MGEELREKIESLISEYCDGTLVLANNGLGFSLERAYFSTIQRGKPQELADRLMELFNDHPKTT